MPQTKRLAPPLILTFWVRAVLLLIPVCAHADGVTELDWPDLIPEGVPYSEIIAEGDKDAINDTWAPVYDANGSRLNQALNNTRVKLPGFIVPLDFNPDGVSEFLLVPYVGACIHVPPPPPNQLIFVTTQTPWKEAISWDAVWVTGTLLTQHQSTELGSSGYVLQAQKIEFFEW